MRVTHRTTAFLLALALLPLPLARAAARAYDGEEEAEEPTEEKKKDEEKERWFALLGGDVHTGTGEVLRGATLVAKNGVIEAIGWDLWYPEDAETLDVAGLSVYPGLVAIEASPSIVQARGGSADGDEHGDAHIGHELEPAQVAWELLKLVSAANAPTRKPLEDSFDPFGQELVLTLSSGITTVATGGSAIKLKRGELDGVVLREAPLETLSWSSKNPAGKRSLRERLAKASAYLAAYRKWEVEKKSDEDKPPSDKEVDKKVLAILKGELRAKFPVSDRGDLVSLARLAQEYDFRPVVQGCQEGWTVAGELGRAGASAILTPRDRRSKDEELVRAGGTTIENAAVLYRHGVQVAVIPAATNVDMNGIMGRDLLALSVEAAFAVRGGLPEDAALASVTSVPARMLGISHRVGTLEKGKDCDLFVADGDWLHYRTLVQYTVVEGKVVYDKEKEVYFSSIRPRPKAEEAEAEEAPEATPPDEGEAEEQSDEASGDDDEKGDEEKSEDEGDEDESEER